MGTPWAASSSCSLPPLSAFSKSAPPPAEPAGGVQVDRGLTDGERDRLRGEHHGARRAGRGWGQSEPLGVEARGRLQVPYLEGDEVGSDDRHEDYSLVVVSGRLTI